MVLAKTEAPYERKDGAADDDPDDGKSSSKSQAKDDPKSDDKGDSKAKASGAPTPKDDPKDDPKGGPGADDKTGGKGKPEPAAADKASARGDDDDRGKASPSKADDDYADWGSASKSEPDKSAAAKAEPTPSAAPPAEAAEQASGNADAPAPAGFDEAPELDADAVFAELLPPEAIGTWDPDAEAPPPGKAPPGDSRSFRRSGADGDEFVLIYRSDSYLITRRGPVGRMGTWTVTEYPFVGSAAHAYAQECSDLTGAGFRDLR